MVSVKEALKIISERIQPTESLEVYTNESYGLTLSKDITAPQDSPTFTRAAMDGYAISDTTLKKYKLVPSMDALDKDTAVRVNTGNLLSDQVKAVVELENTIPVSEECIELSIIPQPHRNMNLVGMEFKKGKVIAKKGEMVSTRTMSLLFYAGILRVSVHRKPIVGLITTGDEVAFPGEKTSIDSVFNSNFYILKGLFNKWGCDIVYFGHAKDSVEDMGKRIATAMDRSDMVVTTGGSSRGSADYTKEVFRKLGVNIMLEKTAIKPGKPMLFGTKNEKPIFGMPGWPSALFSTAYIYLKPSAYKLSGRKEDKFSIVQGILTKPIHSRIGKTYLIRVDVEYRDGNFLCTPKENQTTDNFYTAVSADGLIIADENRGDVKEGTSLPLILFDD